VRRQGLDREASVRAWKGMVPMKRGRPSLAQRAMESEAIVRVYESRLWRRSLLATLAFGISFEREQQLIGRAARLSAGDTLLDLACGPGIYTRPFARELARGLVVGLDLSPAMLRYARRRARVAGLENLALIRGDALHLPFADGRFDVVNCCGALHLFPDADLALREVHRVLKPGGRFTVAAFRRGSGRLATLGGALRRCMMGIDSFTPAELQARLGAAGLGEIACHHAGGQWLIMSARRDPTPESARP
jgi:ubiquinone/menaquinone biosynthesis C-methylase UbiE